MGRETILAISPVPHGPFPLAPAEQQLVDGRTCDDEAIGTTEENEKGSESAEDERMVMG